MRTVPHGSSMSRRLIILSVTNSRRKAVILRTNSAETSAMSLVRRSISRKSIIATRVIAPTKTAIKVREPFTYREDRPRVVQTIRRLIDHGNYPNRLWL